MIGNNTTGRILVMAIADTTSSAGRDPYLRTHRMNRQLREFWWSVLFAGVGIVILLVVLKFS